MRFLLGFCAANYAIGVICGIFLFASPSQDIVSLTDFPVPVWPASGVVPPELKDKYVFIDLAKNEYVLLYPENLGSETFEKDGPGPLKTARYELHRNVEPLVSVTITPVSTQRYKYAYTVTNGPGAKQSIDQWALVLPPQGADAAIRQPAGWMALIQRDRNFKLRNPEWIRNGAAALWSFLKPEQVIPSASSRTGFELETELRPGFSVAYFRKSESTEARVVTQGNIPKAVQEQVDQLLAVEYNSRTLPVIGPKFEGMVTDQAIAADFIEGLNVLARMGAVNPESSFVKTTLMDLKTSPIRLTSTPRGPVETEVFNALKISLKLN